jgi:ribose transport system ATP-binding protein
VSGPASSSSAPLLQALEVSKAFPGVQALAAVDFSVRAGEVHVLLGENGAGKSTLVKVLSGVYRPDEGSLWTRGEPLNLVTPNDALAAGIVTVYQEFNLVPYMTVAQNVFLGQEPVRGRLLDRREIARRTRSMLRELELDLDPNARVLDLGVAHRQIVEIVKALTVSGLHVLIMDEPTAAISRHEINVLFRLIRRLRDRGVGILYISHRLEEIEQIGDRVTVFRDGRRISTDRVADVATDQLIRRMVGREVTQMFPDAGGAPAETALDVERLTLRDGRVRDAAFSVRRGEVVGLFGLVGAGRTEAVRALVGLEPASRDSVVKLFGRPLRLRSPRSAMQRGLGLAPEERKRDGIVPAMTVAANVCLASMDRVSVGPFVSRARMRRAASQYVSALNIVTPSLTTPIESLSGGNQQKCILARLLAADADVLMLDEPTRGIDVGAKSAVYDLIRELTAAGKAVLVVSSDLVEVIGLCDRVVVIREGRVTAEFGREQATEEAVMRAAVPERLEAEAPRSTD